MTREQKEEIFSRRRMIVLSRDITKDVAMEIRNQLIEFNLRSTIEEITILIDCPGGIILSALKVYDFIKLSRAPVKAMVIGSCASSAILVLLACQKRLATTHSTFFLHFVRGAVTLRAEASEEETLQDFEIEWRECKKLQEVIEGLLIARTKLSRDELRKLMRDGQSADQNLLAQQAKEIGLIEEVVEEFDLFAEIEKKGDG